MKNPCVKGRVKSEERKVKSEKGKVKNPYVKGTFYSFAKKTASKNACTLRGKHSSRPLFVLGRYGA